MLLRSTIEDNLTILPGQIFDRAYALAMVQGMNAMLQSFAAAALKDANLRDFIREYRGPIQEQSAPPTVCSDASADRHGRACRRS